jgi:pimeloyl-ACP methyl ester carboxylesterase
MLKTYVWMVILLGISWGGFVVLLALTLRKESVKAKKKKPG